MNLLLPQSRIDHLTSSSLSTSTAIRSRRWKLFCQTSSHKQFPRPNKSSFVAECLSLTKDNESKLYSCVPVGACRTDLRFWSCASSCAKKSRQRWPDHWVPFIGIGWSVWRHWYVEPWVRPLERKRSFVLYNCCSSGNRTSTSHRCGGQS